MTQTEPRQVARYLPTIKGDDWKHPAMMRAVFGDWVYYGDYQKLALENAAAPELLEAAQSALTLLTYDGEDATGFAAKVEADLRAAISKATGAS